MLRTITPHTGVSWVVSTLDTHSRLKNRTLLETLQPKLISSLESGGRRARQETHELSVSSSFVFFFFFIGGESREIARERDGEVYETSLFPLSRDHLWRDHEGLKPERAFQLAARTAAALALAGSQPCDALNRAAARLAARALAAARVHSKSSSETAAALALLFAPLRHNSGQSPLAALCCASLAATLHAWLPAASDAQVDRFAEWLLEREGCDRLFAHPRVVLKKDFIEACVLEKAT